MAESTTRRKLFWLTGKQPQTMLAIRNWIIANHRFEPDYGSIARALLQHLEEWSQNPRDWNRFVKRLNTTGKLTMQGKRYQRNYTLTPENIVTIRRVQARLAEDEIFADESVIFRTLVDELTEQMERAIKPS